MSAAVVPIEAARDRRPPQFIPSEQPSLFDRHQTTEPEPVTVQDQARAWIAANPGTVAELIAIVDEHKANALDGRIGIAWVIATHRHFRPGPTPPNSFSPTISAHICAKREDLRPVLRPVEKAT